MSVTVLDEYPREGGRLLGQLHEESKGNWWNGLREARRLSEQAQHAGASVRTGVSVTGLEREESGDWTVWTSAGLYRAGALLLATGAAESVVPVPGWTLPGVMSIGAAQVMTNVQRVKVGSRGVVIGMSVLAMAIVSELRLAGIELSAIVLPPRHALSERASDPRSVLESLLRFAHLAPRPTLRIGAPLMGSAAIRRLVLSCYPKRGMQIWNTPLQLRRAALEIVGTEKVEGVTLADIRVDGSVIPGTVRFVPADFVCLAGGLYPLAELAAVAGCPFRYVPQLGGHVPLHDERMRTPLSRLYVAGNITGVESAKVAIAQGTVAGLCMAAEANPASDAAELEAPLEEAMAEVRKARQEALIQFQPGIAECREEMYRARVGQQA
jgi:sarcosine oxidase subunit alpha